MDDRFIANWRLHVLRLSGEKFASAPDAVERMTAVQAENYSQTMWALATRTSESFDVSDFDALFNEGKVLRTHVLRPTWHFVRPDDIAWLLELTGPRIRRSLAQIQRELGLSDEDVEASVEVVVDSFSDSASLTRAELGEVLAEADLPASGQRLGNVIMHAESRGLICSGPVVEGQQTYALLSARAPHARRLDREEAVAELVLRYFEGHGPATERDLSYWASMTLTDVRAGLSSVGEQLESFEHDGRTYWFAQPPPEELGATPRGHLLLTLDEYHNGYQDSRHVLDTDAIVPRGRPRNVGMALVDSQMVGGMKRTVGTDRVRFEVNLFRELAVDEREALAEAANRYGDFLDLEPELVFV